jgi:hypothetical protein
MNWKMYCFRNFKTKHKRNCSYRVNIGDYGKGEFGNKKHEHTFLELVQELDKVEGIERLQFRLLNQFIEKNEQFVSKVELLSRIFTFRCNLEAMLF